MEKQVSKDDFPATGDASADVRLNFALEAFQSPQADQVKPESREKAPGEKKPEEKTPQEKTQEEKIPPEPGQSWTDEDDSRVRSGDDLPETRDHDRIGGLKELDDWVDENEKEQERRDSDPAELQKQIDKLQDALNLTEKFFGVDALDTAPLAMELGRKFMLKSDYIAAAAAFSRSVKVLESTYGKDDSRLVEPLSSLAKVLRSTHQTFDVEAAGKLESRADQIDRKSRIEREIVALVRSKPDPDGLAQALKSLAVFTDKTGDWSRASRLQDLAEGAPGQGHSTSEAVAFNIRAARAVFGDNSSETGWAHMSAARLYERDGNPGLAIASFQDAVASFKSSPGKDSSPLPLALTSLWLAVRDVESGERVHAITREAEQFSERYGRLENLAHAIASDADGPETIRILRDLAAYEDGSNNVVKAESYFLDAITHSTIYWKKHPEDTDAWAPMTESMKVYADWLDGRGRREESKHWRKEIEDLNKARENN